MFEASERFAFFDYFRVPYRISSPGPRPTAGIESPSILPRCGALWRTGGNGADARMLLWPIAEHSKGLDRDFALLGRYRLNGNWIFGHVVPDPAARRLLGSTGEGWEPMTRLSDAAGRIVASVWRDARGNIFLPFDPGECMWYFWSERYRGVGRSGMAAKVRSAALRAYYLIRPALPRPVQIGMRRLFAKVQRPPTFPRWPLETALHELYDWLFELLTDFAGTPVPFIEIWPDGHSWAMVLTHDVETSAGYRRLPVLRDVEREAGVRSSWNFVPLREPEEDRYEVEESLLRDLDREGCEVGVHGLRHDGRDLESLSTLLARLPAMRSYAERWNAVGFRAPATQREWDWMPLMGFEYDSSSSDSDPYEPIPGGCCSLLPFFNEGMVELPITLAQDHTLFTILGQRDGASWLRKALQVRDRGGMALVLTHPDYTDDLRIEQAYRSLLEAFADDPSVWRALPREVSDWWRRRANSWLEQTDAGWEVRGPAAVEGGIRFAGAEVGSNGAAERRPGPAAGGA
jgi:hypothetical protein